MSFFDLPNNLCEKLALLSEYINDRDKFVSQGLSFEELADEMDSALNEIDLPPIPANVKVYGNVWIDHSVKIHDQVIIKGPSIICRDAEIGPGAYIRPGTIVGPGAKVGFGVEIKASIIGPSSKIAHRAYVGNTIIGRRSEVSAGVVVATKRFDGAPISTFKTTGERISTGLQKLGAFIGNDVKIGSGVLIMPGAVIGHSVTVYPNVIVKDFLGQNESLKSIFTSKFETVKLLAESHYNENELFWKRNAVFVTIIGALFALFAIFTRQDYGFGSEATIALSLFGLSVSFAWLQVCRMSKFYSSRIESDLKDAVINMPELKNWLKSWAGDREELRPKIGIKATTTVKIVAWISILLWFLIGFSGVKSSLTAPQMEEKAKSGQNIISQESTLKHPASDNKQQPASKDSHIKEEPDGVLKDDTNTKGSVNESPNKRLKKDGQ